jgi:hypothetical protein
MKLSGVERLHGVWQDGELAADANGFQFALAPREIHVWSTVPC